MKCPRCQAENDASGRFCEDCGALPGRDFDAWSLMATIGVETQWTS